MTTTSFFYLRSNRHAQTGSHRFACIAIAKDKPDHYRMSYYLHNPKNGPFVARVARIAAVGRLNSERKSQVLHKDAFFGWGGTLLEVSGITARIQKMLGKDGVTFGTYDTERMQRAIRGGLLELEPRQVAASA